MNLLIKNAYVIDAKHSQYADVMIKDGIIKKIELDIKNSENVDVLDAYGLTLMPSFIDMHCHLRDPGYTYKEDLESGQKAALKGGFTTLCTMANTKPVCDNIKTLKYIKEKAEKLDLCDIIQISAVTHGQQGEKIVDTDIMKSFTNLFSDDGNTITNKSTMVKALELSKKKGFLILTHCQPEAEIISRDLRLQQNINGNLHICHVSLKESVELIRQYKDQGIRFTCEVTPHHIFKPDIDYRVNPSIGSEEDIAALIKAIKEGYIDVIGTDHAPHSEQDKKDGAPGISNIETAFSIVYTAFEKNHIPLNSLSRLMSYKPAKMLNLNAGIIEEGYEANLVLTDLNREYLIDTEDFLSKGKNTPYKKLKVKGTIMLTIKKGRIMYVNRQIA